MKTDILMHCGDVFLNVAVYLEGYYMLKTKNVPPIQFFIYMLFVISGIFWFLWGIFTPNLSQIVSGASALTVQLSILFVITRRYIKHKVINHQSLLLPIMPFIKACKKVFNKIFCK